MQARFFCFSVWLPDFDPRKYLDVLEIVFNSGNHGLVYFAFLRVLLEMEFSCFAVE